MVTLYDWLDLKTFNFFWTYINLICFLGDRTYLNVYDQVEILIAVLVHFMPSDSCKIFTVILYSELDRTFEKIGSMPYCQILCEDRIKNLVYIRSYKVVYNLTSAFSIWVQDPVSAIDNLKMQRKNNLSEIINQGYEFS